MKTCIDCNQSLPFTSFVPKPSYKGGYEHRCRKCRSIKYNKSTPELLCKKIYASQITNSTNRGHVLPDYTLDALIVWMYSQSDFLSMYSDWVNSGYNINKAPSVDRVNDSLPYRMGNLQLLTWQTNRLKASQSKADCELLVNHRAVSAFTKEGVLYKQYQSMAEAMREFGGKATASWGISSVCNGTPVKDGKGKLYTPQTYKGYIWKWS